MADVWAIDQSHSSASFSIRHLMISTVRGAFEGIEGRLVGDIEHLEQASVELTIDVSTVDTRQKDRDKHLLSADFFDVATYPSITFKSKRIEAVGGNRYKVVGDLTIRGTTREVTVDATYGGQSKDPWGGLRAGFTGTVQINRSDYGLVWNQALETGGVLVGDTVNISVDLELVKQAA
jgi:polyisoprenoid-binding protein YceI